MRLKNKVALVTGAASGIGKAIATRFAQEGATVGVAVLDKAGAANVVSEIARFGVLAVPVAMDVTDETQVETRVEELMDRFGVIDVLVSNAGTKSSNQ